MPPFLKQLKQAFLNKRPYLKFLRITSKIIRVCDCDERFCHTYCVTAFVLMTQKIYCKDCSDFFRLYAQEERIFSSEYLGGLVQLLMTLTFFAVLIYVVFYVDRWLKNDFYIDNKVEEL
jgi:hypothetical protein